MISSRDIVEITISIHAPTRGATSQAFAFVQAMSYFNPRSYKRSDQLSRKLILFASYFNPRSYKRSDLQDFNTKFLHLYFNPRSYKRSDFYCGICGSCSYHFNPRSYKRSDYSGADVPAELYISIHAPTRGATHMTAKFQQMQKFQSTLLQEERLWQCFQCFLGVIFQSTLLQEERQFSCKNPE